MLKRASKATEKSCDVSMAKQEPPYCHYDHVDGSDDN